MASVVVKKLVPVQCRSKGIHAQLLLGPGCRTQLWLVAGKAQSELQKMDALEEGDG